MKTTTISANPHNTLLALAVVVALCGSGALSARAMAATSPFTTVAHTTRLGNGDAVIGALPMGQPIHIEVALKMRDREGLDAFIADNVKKLANHVAPHLMTSAEFLATHAPTQQQAQAVANYLTGMGYRNVVIAPNRLLVSADGTATTARNAFMTTFAQVRTHDGRIAFANTDEVRIPATLANKVLAVVGLQTVHQAHTLTHAINAGPVTTNDPFDFPSIYGSAGVAAESKVIVGMITTGDLARTKSDLALFATNHGLSAIATDTVTIGGSSRDMSAAGQWDLVSQNIVGMAGDQLKQLIFYNIPDLTHTSLLADFNAIVTANKAWIIDASIGECETFAQDDGSATADDAIFETAVAQGQTFSIPAGDSGADACVPARGVASSWPAASQYVVAVMGGGRGSVIPSRMVEGAGVLNQPPSANFSYTTTGQTAAFTDTSTDADGNIASYFWKFGDGATSTAVNPTHAYAAAGTYSVKEQVKDLDGAIGSKIKSVTVAPVQLLKNTGFETGTLAHWLSSESNGVIAGPPHTHSGSWYFAIGGSAGLNHDHLTQTVTLPSGLTSATLTFYLANPFEGQGTYNGDPVKVEVWSGSHFLSTLAVYSNEFYPSTYVRQDLDMTPYIGQTVSIKFIKINRPAGLSSWALDDVTLTAQ